MANSKLKRAFFLSLALTLSACALPGQGNVPIVKDCVLSADQAGTLSGNWKATPVPIAFFNGNFGSGEIAAMTAGADSWNQFSAASFGTSVIDYGDPGNPRTSSAGKPSALCAQGIISNGKYTGSVVIYKDGTWPYTSMPSAIALTSFCVGAASGQPIPNMYMAIMEINYQNFFVNGQKVPDLQSIVTHELGHMLGLGHSCENFDKAGVPNCSSTSLPSDYFQAIMYPVFGFDATGYGEQKRVLAPNDEGRANCLYIPGALTTH